VTVAWPAEHELAWRNRRILADRLGWPVGAVQECEWVEREHPGWSPHWREANAWSGQPAGYYALRYDHDRRDAAAYGVSRVRCRPSPRR